MAKKQAVVNPAETISVMRTDALLAYLEWPVFLHIRLKELNEALAITGESSPTPLPSAQNNPEVAKAVAVPPEPALATNFVPERSPGPVTDAVTDFLAEFPDGEGHES